MRLQKIEPAVIDIDVLRTQGVGMEPVMTVQLPRHAAAARRGAGAQPRGILQAQKASTPPLCHFVHTIADPQTWWERGLRRLVSAPTATGWELFRRRRDHQVVITSDYRTSLVFGALSNVYGRLALHVVKELYLDESVLRSVRARRVFRWCLRRCECVITNGTAEIDAYSEFLGLPRERFHFLAWPANLPAEHPTGDDGSVFAAGRSCRDWATLFAAAASVPARFVVVAEAAAVAGLARPANVELYCDVPRERYLHLLRRARVVVVPLLPTIRSAGQAALLEAMALGKPVLTAQIAGVVDYLRPNQTGVFYQAEDAGSLARELNRLLSSADFRARIAAGGQRSVETVFNKRCYAHRVQQLLEDLLGEPLRPPALQVGCDPGE
jgi:glycosyltransferase involved in cell wall biosynthesis